MNLRATVNSIMKKWGHDVLLQRKLVSPPTGGLYGLQENSGYSKQLERHTTRHRWPNQSGGLTGVLQEQTEGVDAQVDLIYYFLWDVNPKSGDRIYDKNPTGWTHYTIDWALPMRFQNGRIEYWITGVSMESEGLVPNG